MRYQLYHHRKYILKQENDYFLMTRLSPDKNVTKT